MRYIQMKKSILSLFFVGVAGGMIPQIATAQQEESKPSKAWEIGVGGNLLNWNRISITDFRKETEGYKYNMNIDHLLGGGHLYVAHELCPWFYLDLQGSINVASVRYAKATKELQQVWMGGLGAQFRLSPFFRSQYVEPYLRVGVNYLYKNFSSVTAGGFSGDDSGESGWKSTDFWNNTSHQTDKNSFIPLSFGAGVNAWLSNSLGIGLQGEYLLPIEKGLSRSAQVSLRIIYRIGGKDKRPAPRIEYVNQVVEKIVERPVERIVEKVVERVVPAEVKMYDLLENITFDFDKYELKEEAHALLDQLAEILKRYDGYHFLLTGYTDACGTEAYNQSLSKNRARTVMQELVKRGIPATQLRARGVGKRAAALSAQEPNKARLGDRKVTIEFVTNSEYWERLPEY